MVIGPDGQPIFELPDDADTSYSTTDPGDKRLFGEFSPIAQIGASIFGGPLGAGAFSLVNSGGDIKEAAKAAALAYAGQQIAKYAGGGGVDGSGAAGDLTVTADGTGEAGAFNSYVSDVGGGGPGWDDGLSNMMNDVPNAAYADIFNPIPGFASASEASIAQANATADPLGSLIDSNKTNWGGLNVDLGISALNTPSQPNTASPDPVPDPAAPPDPGLDPAAAAEAEAMGAGIYATEADLGSTWSSILDPIIKVGGAVGGAAAALGTSVLDAFKTDPFSSIAKTLSGAASAYGLYEAVKDKKSPEEQAADAARAAALADPQAPFRAGYAQKVNDLVNNPSLAMGTPGYQFLRDQGQQAIDRGYAKQGQTTSGNRYAGISKWNQDYAFSNYSKLLDEYSGLAGGNTGQASAASNQSLQQGTSQNNLNDRAIGTNIGGLINAVQGIPQKAAAPVSSEYNLTADQFQKLVQNNQPGMAQRGQLFGGQYSPEYFNNVALDQFQDI